MAFDDIKPKHFSNALSDSSVYVISCIRQTVAQELGMIHVLVYIRGVKHTAHGPNPARCGVGSGPRDDFVK